MFCHLVMRRRAGLGDDTVTVQRAHLSDKALPSVTIEVTRTAENRENAGKCEEGNENPA